MSFGILGDLLAVRRSIANTTSIRKAASPLTTDSLWCQCESQREGS